MCEEMKEMNGIMDKVEIKSFCIKITRKQAEEIYDMEKYKLSSNIGFLIESGAFIPKNVEFIVEFPFGDNKNYYFASADMLVKSSDGISCQLKHDINEALSIEDLPNFKEIFKSKEL